MRTLRQRDQLFRVTARTTGGCVWQVARQVPGRDAAERLAERWMLHGAVGGVDVEPEAADTPGRGTYR